MSLGLDVRFYCSLFAGLSRNSGELVSLITHFSDLGRVADQDDALATVGQLTEDLQDLPLRVAVKIACGLMHVNIL